MRASELWPSSLNTVLAVASGYSCCIDRRSLSKESWLMLTMERLMVTRLSLLVDDPPHRLLREPVERDHGLLDVFNTRVLNLVV